MSERITWDGKNIKVIKVLPVTYLESVYEVMVRVARMTAHGVAFVPSDRVKDLESLGLIAELNNDCEV